MCIIRYKICINQSATDTVYERPSPPWLSTGYMSWPRSPPSALCSCRTTRRAATRRAEHNSWPEQRAPAKAPAFPSWQNSISPQVVQQTHRLLPEEIKYLNKQRVVCFSHARRKTQWIRIIQCHDELTLKRQKSVYSEWNRVNKHRSLLFFFF